MGLSFKGGVCKVNFLSYINGTHRGKWLASRAADLGGGSGCTPPDFASILNWEEGGGLRRARLFVCFVSMGNHSKGICESEWGYGNSDAPSELKAVLLFEESPRPQQVTQCYTLNNSSEKLSSPYCLLVLGCFFAKKEDSSLNEIPPSPHKSLIFSSSNVLSSM